MRRSRGEWLLVASGWWLGRPVGAVGIGIGTEIGIGIGAFRYSRRGLRLRRRGAYGIHRACRPSVPRVVSPQGKRLTMICASLALLQIMFAVHR